MNAARTCRFAFPFAAVFFIAALPVRAAVPLPSGGKLESVDFERHVMGLFGKTGCNNGSCHGSFQGKNGFRLSLFGYEPERDFAALTREIQGRRLDPVDPDASLLLQKATGEVRHEGGVRFSRDSWQYAIFREWISQGAHWTKGSGAVVEMAVEPKEYVFVEGGKSVPMKVTARFSDGSTEEITPFCEFRVTDDSVASVTPLGEVTALKPGDAGLVISYRGQVRAARILVPAATQPGFVYPQLPESNYIDTEVLAKLRRLNMVPSNLSGDGEFLRRVYVDTIGSLPSPEEVRAFLADTSPDKRTKKIDELLAHPLHAAIWATKFSDITGNNTDALENPQQLKVARSQLWHDWLRKRLAENMPYDEIVKGIMVATSLEGKSPQEWIEETKKVDEALPKFDTSLYASRKTLDLYWRRQQQVPIEQWGEKAAAAFLGVRLECAQCHKHPTDRWTQEDYWSFANIFSQVTFPGRNQYSTSDVKKLADALNGERTAANSGKNNNQLLQVREVYLASRPAGKPNPAIAKVPPPKLLGGPELKVSTGHDLREDLFHWMASAENPFFARSFVNRVWAHYLGVGLVDPVDDFSLANPPTNARLLEALARDFTEHGYDIRQIERTILNSRTYQLSATANESNKFDKNNFARAYIRPMMAEVVVDVLNSALDVDEELRNDNIPAGKRMIEIGASRFQNQNLAYVLRIFGRPPRTTACDCERAMDPALPQTLYRMTDPAILGKLKDSKNRLSQLLRTKKSDEEVLDELFLATLTRLPTAYEKEAFAEHRQHEKDRNAVFTDTLWALINTREFILNH
jgi:hypothetical protein